LALVYEEQDGEAASCLQSLFWGWRSYAQALVRARCRIEDKNLNICLNEDKTRQSRFAKSFVNNKYIIWLSSV
jgi:hypothetical protein